MNQFALITGASTGIGRELSFKYAQAGFNLILIARREELLKTLKQKIQTEKPDCEVILLAADVGDYKKFYEDLKSVLNACGPVAVAIANAGIGLTTDEAGNTWDKSLKTYEVNLLGALATLEVAKDKMLAQGFGQLVGISSVAGYRGLPLTGAYCASKAAITTHLESMRGDLKSRNIGVTSVHPGFVATPMTEKNGKMAWVVSAGRAAEIIFNGIQKRKARIIFPWQMRFMVIVMRLVPDFLFDWAMSLGHDRARVFRERRD